MRASLRPRSSLFTVVSGLFAARISSLALTVAVGVVLARSLGPSDRGVFAVLLSIATIGSVMFTAGADTATLRTAGAGHLDVAVRATGRRVALTALAAIACWAALVSTPLLTPLAIGPEAALIAALAVPVFAANQLLGNCLLGAGRTREYAAQTILMATAYLASALALAASDLATVPGFMMCLTGSYILSVALCAFWLRSALSGATRDRAASEAFRATARKSAASTYAQLAFLRVQAPALQIFSTSAAVGLLASAMPVAEVLLLLPVLAGTILIPRYSGTEPTLMEVRRHAVRVAGATLVGALLVGGSAPWLIPFAYGTEYADATHAVWAMLPGVVVFASARTAQSYLVSQGLFAAITIGAVCALAVSLVGQAVLAPRFGATGAGAAVSIGYLAASTPLLMTLRRGR